MGNEFGITPELSKLLGHEWKFTSPEELGKSSIRMFALAVGDRNPLYIDNKYASGSKYGGIIAPPTFICETTQFMTDILDTDGGPINRPKILPGPDIRGGNEYSFLQPVRPDDILDVSWKISDIVEKNAKTGKLIIVTSEITYYNQHAELLAVNSETTIFRDPASSSPNLMASPPVSGQSPVPQEPPPNPARSLDNALMFEEVEVGDDIPTITKNITFPSMVFYGASTWDFHRFHYDQEFVNSRGFSSPFVDGQELGAFLAQLLTDWTGDPGRLQNLSFRFRGFVFPGETLICKGKVIGKESQAGTNIVHCEMTIETLTGKVALSPGKATITLPSGT